jgi:hypothetical protein
MKHCPWPNTYWVEPGILLAGEYPGDQDEWYAEEKLGRLLDVGVRTFIDLTAADELIGYDTLLHELAARRGVEVRYERRSICDMSVPAEPAVMVRILDLIDEARSAGRTTFVHCWGGIGRTGTVVGCHLVRRGLSGEDALVRVAELFAAMAKAPLHNSPQTFEQCEWVRSWSSHDVRPDRVSTE